MTRSPVSVVVLSYDRPAMLGDALASLRAQTVTPAELIVVDNPSPSSEEIRGALRRQGDVTLVTPATNLGFAGGMNLGLARVAHDVVLLTEDDIVLEPDCLERLMAVLGEQPTAGLLAPVIFNKESGSVRSAGGSLSLGGVFRHVVFDRVPDGMKARPVDFVPGAILLGRTRLLRTFGGFRDDFFMYSEDSDLCLRLARAGHPVLVCPRAACSHFEPPVRPESRVLEYHRFKNLIALYLLHASPAVWPEFTLRYGVGWLVRRPSQAFEMARAWGWAALNAPRLLAERFGWRPRSPLVAVAATVPGHTAAH